MADRSSRASLERGSSKLEHLPKSWSRVLGDYFSIYESEIDCFVALYPPPATIMTGGRHMFVRRELHRFSNPNLKNTGITKSTCYDRKVEDLPMETESRRKRSTVERFIVTLSMNTHIHGGAIEQQEHSLHSRRLARPGTENTGLGRCHIYGLKPAKLKDQSLRNLT
ncbi:hypothetical protein J6590_017586 [Homalodisca vitripennis]|nr:hypothetical protein J6590_017586 [Homalodisca vitripennis]